MLRMAGCGLRFYVKMLYDKWIINIVKKVIEGKDAHWNRRRNTCA